MRTARGEHVRNRDTKVCCQFDQLSDTTFDTGVGADRCDGTATQLLEFLDPWLRGRDVTILTLLHINENTRMHLIENAV